MNVRYVLLLKQSSQHEGKTRLPQKDCVWRAAALLCAIFFQFLRESLVCPPFRFHHHRVRQKFERRRDLLHVAIQPRAGIQFAHDWDDRHVTAFHLFELAFQERQFVIRPSIDEVRKGPDSRFPCAPAEMFSAVFDPARCTDADSAGCKPAGRTTESRCSDARVRHFVASSISGATVFSIRKCCSIRCTPVAAVTQSQFRIAQQLLKRVSQAQKYHPAKPKCRSRRQRRIRESQPNEWKPRDAPTPSLRGSPSEKHQWLLVASVVEASTKMSQA